MRNLGIDFGDKRIGVAISDELNMFAHPLKVIENRGMENNIKAIAQIIEMNRIEKVVVGYPLNMNGTSGERCEKTDEFVNELQACFRGEIIKWDERLTTVSADKMLIEFDMSRKKRKKVIDKIAACYILQGYLDMVSKK